jgi:hypothetical protein
MTSALPAIVTTAGLVCDIAGALLVANEVVRIFRGPAAIDIGDAGCFNGSTRIVPNPDFEAHEQKKRRYMKWGLALLIGGFILQGIGTWLPILYPVPASIETTQAATAEPWPPSLTTHIAVSQSSNLGAVNE